MTTYLPVWEFPSGPASDCISIYPPACQNVFILCIPILKQDREAYILAQEGWERGIEKISYW